MKKICLIFNTHQPVLLSKFRFYEIGGSGSYFNQENNRARMQHAAVKKYGPINQQLMALFIQFTKDFKVSFAFSGTTMDLMETCCPDIIQDLKKINDLGSVEFLGETYSHSILNLNNEQEFIYQTNKQKIKVLNLFGQYPRSFLNTNDFSLEFLNSILPFLEYDLVINQETNNLPKSFSKYALYQIQDSDGLKMLFSENALPITGDYQNTEILNRPPLSTASEFIYWMNSLPEEDLIITLLFDYKSLLAEKEVAKPLLNFILELPQKALESNIGFITPLEAALSDDFFPKVTKASFENKHREQKKPLNQLQNEILDILVGLKDKVYQTKDEHIVKAWYYLQDDINLLEMSFESKNSVSLQNDQNPFSAYINYRNILDDFTKKIDQILLNLKEQMQSRNYASLIKAQRNKIGNQPLFLKSNH